MNEVPFFPHARIGNNKQFVTSLAGCDVWLSPSEGLFVQFGPQQYNYSWPQDEGRLSDRDWDERVPPEVRTFILSYRALTQ